MKFMCKPKGVICYNLVNNAQRIETSDIIFRKRDGDKHGQKVLKRARITNNSNFEDWES